MKIESIREALKLKAQNLNITPPPAATALQERSASAPSTTSAQEKSISKEKKTVSAKDTPAVVIPFNTVTGLESTTPSASTVEAKAVRKTASRKPKGNQNDVTMSGIEAIIAGHLRAGIDYTTLPRCGNKPVLLKGGAEHLSDIFGFRTMSEIVYRFHVPERNFVLYEVATTVYDKEDKIRAVGLGSCNTLESKYVKQGMAMSLNTVLKMARKRSYVDAVLSATGSSRIFTQDIEEVTAISEEFLEKTSRM